MKQRKTGLPVRVFRLFTLVLLLFPLFTGTTPAALVDNGDGTVTDTVTYLMWQQASMDPDNDTTPDAMTWEQALYESEHLALAGYSDWRLPDINELRSIVDCSRYNPAIDTVLFPDTVSSNYWSSTTSANYSNYAWSVYFRSGNDNYFNKSSRCYVRAVRGGQSGSFSGVVNDNSGSGIDDVIISLTGTNNYTTSTLNGHYNFSALPDGTYTITPSFGSFQFDPPYRSVTISLGNPLPRQNFSACIPGTTLSGYLVNATTNGFLANTTFTMDGVNVTTDGNGYYEVNNLSCDDHLIEVDIEGFFFYDYNVSTFDHSDFNIQLTRPGTVNGPDVYSGFGGDPVNTATGNYILSSKDLSIPGKGIPIAFKRFYNSQNPVDGPVGYGWGHNYHVNITTDADDSVTVHWGDGKTQTWTPDGTGGFTPQYGVFDTLSDNGDDTYTLTKKDQTSYHFDTSLRLASIVDKNSNAISLIYTGDNLTQITDTVGRSIGFTYDTSGRIIEVTDPIARTFHYTYDSNGDLVQAEDFDGNATNYTYDNLHQMLTAVDSKGNTFVTNVYDAQSRVVTSQSDAKGGQTFYVYDTENNRTTITDPLGQIYYHYHDELKRLIQEEDALVFSNYFTYDEAGNRTEVTDKKGNQTFYAYDTFGNVTSKTNAMGLITSITYDGSNNPLTRTDPHYDTTAFAYDANGNLTQTTDPLGNTTTTTYTVDGLPETQADALGNISTFGYDSHGNLVLVTDPLGNTTTNTYDGVGRRLNHTGSLGNTTSLTYDANNNLLTKTDGLGNVTVHSYDANNKRVSRTDPLGYTTTFEYDAKDLLTVITDVVGNPITYSYDALDRKITETDRNGNTTAYSYDAVGNLMTTTDPLGNSSTSTYDANGNRLSIIDPLGNTTIYQYDVMNRVIIMTDALGNQTQYEYDGLGRKVGVTDPNGNTTLFSYGIVGNMVATTDALGNATTFTFDANNNKLTATNPLGQTTSYQYDALNRKTTITDPLGNSGTLSYDAAGQLIASTNAKGEVTQFEYDTIKRLITVTDPAGGIMSYTYDANGNRLSMSDTNSQVTGYTYDALNRRISQTEALGNLTLYSYDAVGNRSSMTDPNGATTGYTYDARNSLVEISYPGSTVNFSYDANGNRLDMVDSLGTTSYFYDTINRLIGVTDPFGQQVGYGYDSASNRTVLNYPGDKAVNYSYDALNRVVSLTDWLGNVTTYMYDTAGRLAGTTNPNATRVTYTYDAAGRRIGLLNQRTDDSVIAGYTFTLDEIGNHLQVSEEQPLTAVWSPISADYSYDAENRLTSQGTDSLTYDNNGNLTGQETDIFAYDAQNKLISSQINGQNRQYTYNGQGNRYDVVTDGTVKRVVWDVSRKLAVILAETDVSNAITAYYVYGLGLVSKILPDDTTYSYHYDTRGSTVAITDHAETIINSYAYDEYGSVQNAVKNLDNPFDFLGRYGIVDDGNDLNYIRARYYKPGIGRFITKDPKPGDDRSGQSWNRYGYALGNPVILVDVSGFKADTTSSDKENLYLIGDINIQLSREELEELKELYINFNIATLTELAEIYGESALESFLKPIINANGFNVAGEAAYTLYEGVPLIGIGASIGIEYNRTKDLHWMERWSRISFEAGASAAGSLVTIATGGNVYAGATASIMFSTFGYKGVEAIGDKVGGFLYDELGIYNPDSAKMGSDPVF